MKEKHGDNEVPIMTPTTEWQDKPVKYLRDVVIEQLKYNLANNHLETEEFDQLVRLALSTQSRRELLSLTKDLPVKGGAGPVDRTGRAPAETDPASVVCILSSSKRPAVPAGELGELNVTTVLGELELDFRGVRLMSDLTEVMVKCWMGEVRIIVPPGLNVVCSLKSLLADVENRAHSMMDPAQKTVVFRGKVVLGEFKIIVKP
jgi:hypothetical protein